MGNGKEEEEEEPRIWRMTRMAEGTLSRRGRVRLCRTKWVGCVNPSLPLLVRFDDLADGFLQADRDVPVRIVGAHLGEIGDVADVVADAVFLDVLMDLGLSGEFLGDSKRFPDGAGVGAAAADGSWFLAICSISSVSSSDRRFSTE